MSLSENQVNTMSSQQVRQPIRALENTLRLLQLNHSGIHDSSNSVEIKPFDYSGILDTDLTTLTPEECLTFRIIICVLCTLSLAGNISTLAVNLRRKMRPFFRACLISLALSDLLNTVFLTTVYFAQFSTEYVQIWVLGSIMCGLVPFTTTVAILASSLTLVVIALDRYFAVMKAFVSHWKPGHIAGVLCMVGIWVISFGISAPVFWIYRILSVYILTEVNIESGEPSEETSWQAEASKENLSYTLVKVEKLVLMCVTDKRDVTLFYIIVFNIIFVPCIISFVWLNVTIAKNIWVRRHKVPQSLNSEKNQEGFASTKATSGQTSKVKPVLPASTEVNSTGYSKSTKLSAITSSKDKNRPTKYKNVNNTREARHYRMVVVIILLIAVFICMRLPAWIFLLMRMYGSYTRQKDWIIYFSFGILNMASCALNPLFYTFLHETIEYILCCKMRCGVRKRRVQRCVGLCYCCNSSMPNDASFDVGCCACCGLFCGIFGMCSGPKMSKSTTSNVQDANVVEQRNNKPRPLSLEKDEGVDCSDASFYDDDDSDENGNAFEHNEENVSSSCSQQVFTVFSVSLMQVPVDLAFKDSEI